MVNRGEKRQFLKGAVRNPVQSIALVDADLRSIVDAWSQLTRSTKAEILDMVRTGIARRPRI